MVALFRQSRRVNRCVVAEQRRIPLVSIAGHESVETVEAKDRAGRPTFKGTSRADFLRWRVVPFPDGESVVAIHAHQGPDAGLVHWLARVVSRIASGQLRDVGHADGMMIPSRKQTGPRR